MRKGSAMIHDSRNDDYDMVLEIIETIRLGTMTLWAIMRGRRLLCVQVASGNRKFL